MAEAVRGAVWVVRAETEAKEAETAAQAAEGAAAVAEGLAGWAAAGWATAGWAGATCQTQSVLRSTDNGGSSPSGWRWRGQEEQNSEQGRGGTEAGTSRQTPHHETNVAAELAPSSVQETGTPARL